MIHHPWCRTKSVQKKIWSALTVLSVYAVQILLTVLSISAVQILSLYSVYLRCKYSHCTQRICCVDTLTVINVSVVQIPGLYSVWLWYRSIPSLPDLWCRYSCGADTLKICREQRISALQRYTQWEYLHCRYTEYSESICTNEHTECSTYQYLLNSACSKSVVWVFMKI